MMLIISNRKTENTEYFKNPEELEAYLKLHPEINTLLFAFWSWIVPKWMLDTYKVYGMHTGPLLEGKGRGGSPIDNLQALGVKITTLCVFKMTEKIDGGRVVLAMPLRINCPKDLVVYRISHKIPDIVDYLKQDITNVPEVFRRIQ